MSQKKDNSFLRSILIHRKANPVGFDLSFVTSKSTRKLKAFFGVIIISLSIVTMSGLGNLLVSQPAGAVTKASDMSLADQTLSYVYLNALRKCTRDGKINDNNTWDSQLLISPASIDSGEWFRNEAWNNGSPEGPSVTHPSYLAPGVGSENGELKCNDVVKEATKLWGFSNPKALFCSFVTERANGSSCDTGNGDFGKDEFIGHQADLNNAVKKQVYNNQNPTMQKNGGYPGRYLLYLAAFTTGCSAKESANPSADFKYTVKIVGDDGVISDPAKVYEGAKHDTKRYVYIDRDDLNDIELTCKEIADRVNQYSGDYAVYRKGNPTEPTTPGGTDTGANSDGGTSCAIDGVGWIICPVVNFLAGLADGSFKILSDSLLRTDVNLVSAEGPTYTAWTVMRNLANVAFVIIFLIIIFSQLSGVGISNYGVKKMLPRLVVAAILVNVSYFICQLAVDLSNILGYSVKDALGGVGNSIVEQSKSLDGVSPFADGNGFLGIAGGILALSVGGVIIYAMLSVLMPILLAVVIALVMILFILIARQAIVVILIVLSPLAFVAFLLPNTERLFKMWQKMLTAMLLLFPIIALVFGLSSLASDIISLSSSGDFGNTDANNWFSQIVAAAVLVLPLFLVPTLLKKSLDGIPVLGQMANKLSSRANSKVGSAIKESNRGSLFARGSAMRKNARENYRTRKFAERISKGGVVGKANQVMASGLPILAADRYANKALARTAEEVSSEALSKDVVAAGKSMEGQISKTSARDIAHGRGGKSLDGKKTYKGGDVATQMAGIDKVVASNDIAGMNELWEASQSWSGPDSDKLRTHLANRIQGSGSKPAYFGAGALEMLRTNQHGDTANGVKSANQLMTAAVAGNAYSPEKVAKTDKDELAAVFNASEDRAAQDATFAVSHGTKLAESANAALNDTQLARGIDKNLGVVNGMAGRPGSTPPPPIT